MENLPLLGLLNPKICQNRQILKENGFFFFFIKISVRFWVKMLKLWLYPKTSEDVQLRVKHDVTAKTTIFVSFNPQADNFVNIEKKLEKYFKKIHYQTLTKNYNKKLKKKTMDASLWVFLNQDRQFFDNFGN